MYSWFRKLSWKIKLLLAFVAGSLFMVGFLFSSWGQDMMRDKIVQYYNDTPESERRDSPWAQRYIDLAYIRGNIMGDTEAGMEMYKNFLGLKVDDKGRDVFQTQKLNGLLVSVDGKTGWGPAHPLAADAYYNYLVMFDENTNASGQFVGQKAWQYYELLYTYVVQHNLNDHKASPRFKAHWQAIQLLAQKSHFPRPSGVELPAPKAPDLGEDNH